MPITVEMLEDNPIVIATFHEPFDSQSEIPLMLSEIKSCRERAEKQVVVIVDLSNVKLNFQKIVISLGEVGSQIRNEQSAGALLPRKYIFVGDSTLVKLAAKAMGQLQYGGIGGSLTSSMDEALNIARTVLAEPAEGD